MKKLMASFVAMALLVVSLSGCNSIMEDKIPATAEITTSEGDAYVVNSVNGTNKNVSGATYAVTYAPFLLSLTDGESATIYFYCPACGHEENDTISAPFAKLYKCECPEKMGKNGAAREYICITTSTK